MNRRNFLKRCSLIPFVGSMAIVGQSGASERQLVRPEGWIDVKTYGVRDDTKSIQEAIDLTANHFYYTIYLDEGVFITPKTIRIPEGIELKTKTNIRIEGNKWI